jgi:hypothetical protein
MVDLIHLPTPTVADSYSTVVLVDTYGNKATSTEVPASPPATNAVRNGVLSIVLFSDMLKWLKLCGGDKKNSASMHGVGIRRDESECVAGGRNLCD